MTRVSATYKRDQTVAGPPQSPTEREEFIDNQQVIERERERERQRETEREREREVY